MRTAVPYPPPFPQLTSKVHSTMSQSTYRARSVKVHLPSPHPSAKDAAKHPAREGGGTRLGRHRNKNGGCAGAEVLVKDRLTPHYNRDSRWPQQEHDTDELGSQNVQQPRIRDANSRTPEPLGCKRSQ